MVNYSICLEPVLTDRPFHERMEIAAELGFDGVEFWEPSGKDMKKIGAAAARLNLAVAGMCLLNQWEIRANADPRAVVKNLKDTIAFTADTGCRSFLLMAGDAESHMDTQKNILIENLKRMAEVAEQEEIRLLLEPLNVRVDHKGYYLDSAHLAYEIVKCVDSSRVKVLYDCYHMQIMEGNMIETMEKNLTFTGHIHSAGVPGRNEPFWGEINYPGILRSIVEKGYDGFIGLEYWPTYDHARSMKDSLAHLKSFE